MGSELRSSKIAAWLSLSFWLALIASFSGSFGAESTIANMANRLLAHLWPSLFANGAELGAVDTGLGLLRKPAHVLLYAVLTLLIFRVARVYVPGRSRVVAAWALLLCAACAAADEVHQATTGIRSPRLSDVLLDVCAGFVALWLLEVWAARRACSSGGADPDDRGGDGALAGRLAPPPSGARNGRPRPQARLR